MKLLSAASRLSPAIAALLLLAAGCDPLSAFDPVNTCGNGVVESEAGEFCDTYLRASTDMPADADMAMDYSECGKPSTAAACHWRCDPAGGHLKCPAAGGFKCGLDGICHVPTASFKSPAVLPIGAGEVHVGDINGDSHPDFVVVEELGVGVYLGGLLGGYSRIAGAPNNPGRISLALGRLADPSAAASKVDVALLVNDDLVHTIGSSNGQLLPVAYPWYVSKNASAQPHFLAVRAVAPYDQQLLLELWAEMGASLQIRVQGDAAVVVESSALAALGPMPGFVLSREAGDIDRGGKKVGPTADEFVIVPQGSSTAFVFSLECTTDRGPCAVVSRGVVSPHGQGVDSTFFSDFDGDGKLDVAFRLSMPEMMMGMDMGGPRTVVAYGDGNGNFSKQPGSSLNDGAATLDLSSLLCPVCQLGAGFILAVADLDGDGKPDVVGDNGIRFVRAKGDVAAGPGPSGNVWLEAVVSDFNKDGRADVALLTAGHGGVDLLVGAGQRTFNQLFVNASSSIVHALRSGDYDGDGFVDLSLITEMRSVNVLFSDAHGLPRTKALQASVEAVESLITVDRGPGLPSDLVLSAKHGPAGNRTVARLSGHGGQFLRTSIGLPAAAGLNVDRPLDSITLGRFAGHGGALADTLILSRDGSTRSLFLLETHDPIGDQIPSPQKMATTNCEALLGANQPRLLPTDVNGDGRDEVVAVVSIQAMGIMRSRTSVLWSTLTDGHDKSFQLDCQTLADADPDPSAAGGFLASAAEVVDVDGDGNADVLVTLRSSVSMGAMMSPVTYGYAVYYGQKNQAEPFERTPHYYPSAGLRAVTAINGVLVVVTDSDISQKRVQVGGPPPQMMAPPRPPPAGVTALYAADVDGDGLDDLVLAGESTSVMFQKECSAADFDHGTCIKVPVVSR